MQWAKQPSRGASKPAWSSHNLVPGNLHDALSHLDVLNDRLVHKHIRPQAAEGFSWGKFWSRICCFIGLSVCLALVIMVTSDISQMVKFAPELGGAEKDIFNDDVPTVDIDFSLGGANSEPSSVFGESPGSDVQKFAPSALGPQEILDENPPSRKEPGLVVESPEHGQLYMPQVVYPGQKLDSVRHLPDPLISSWAPPEPERADLIGRGIDALNAKVVRPAPRVDP
eukprot:3294124-Pyramimonas_sp.AAC.1